MGMALYKYIDIRHLCENTTFQAEPKVVMALDLSVQVSLFLYPGELDNRRLRAVG